MRRHAAPRHATVALACVAALVACTGVRADRAVDTAALASAKSNGVTVRLDDGRTIALVDSGYEESIMIHRDHGRLPRVPIHVVAREMWEAWDYLLVDLRTGDTISVPDAPVVSPSGRRLAVTSMDFENGYAPTVVEIWRIDPDSVRLEWREQSGESYPDNTGWGASDVRWEDDSTARFTRAIPHGEDGPVTTAPARFLFRSGKWYVEPALP